MELAYVTTLNARAKALGFELGDDFQFNLYSEHDPDTWLNEYEDEVFTDEIRAAWRADEWHFAILTVYVLDDNGRQWGADSIGSVVLGHFGDQYLKAEEYYGLDDLISNAGTEAKRAIEEFIRKHG